MLILIKVCKYFALLDLRLDFHELNVEEVNWWLYELKARLQIEEDQFSTSQRKAGIRNYWEVHI